MTAQLTSRKSVLVTRPRPQGERFAAEVEAAQPGRWRCRIAQVMRIAFLDSQPDLTGVTDLIFTSSNGVKAFSHQTPDRTLPAICVGTRTTGAARDAGFNARCGGPTAQKLLQRLAEDGSVPGATFLHVRGAHATGSIAATLAAAGHGAREAVVYDQVPQPLPDDVLQDLSAGCFDAITFFSPRSVDLFAGAVESGGLGGDPALLCLSEEVARRARTLSAGSVVVAPTPDSGAMIRILAQEDDY